MKKFSTFLVRLSLTVIGILAANIVVKAQNFGVDVSNPQEKLDVNGAIRIGNTTNSNAGTIRYSSVNQKFQVNINGTWYDLATTSNSQITNVTYNSTTDILTITENGTNWTVNLSELQDNTDDQTISYNATTNVITLEDGGTIDLSDLQDNTDEQTLNEVYGENGNAVTMNSTSGDVRFFKTGNEIFMLKESTGFVGIGTNTPATKLHVNETSTGNAVRISESGDGDGLVIAEGNNGNALVVTNTGAGHAATFNGGNVGIGTTNPQQALEVTGTARVSTLVSGANGAVVTSNSNGDMSYTNYPNDNDQVLDGTGNWVDINTMLNGDYIENQTTSNQAAGFRITGNGLFNGGNVGIGTVTPNSLLNVYEPSASPTQTDFTQSVNNSGILVTSDYTNGDYVPGIFWNTQNENPTKPKAGIYLQTNTAGSKMILSTSTDYPTGITNSAVVIDQDANVGIGSSSPIQALDVVGDVNTSTGFRIANAAAAGQFLRGNGTKFVSSAIQPGDVPTGSGNYIQNQISAAQSSSNFWISGSGRSSGDLRAPIFYDQNDNGYYMDPNSISRVYRLGFNGQNTINSGIYIWSTTDNNHVIYSSGVGVDGGARQSGYWDSNHRMRFRSATGQGFLFENSSNQTIIDIDSDNGNLYAAGQLRSPIYYDANNTGYYVDPASTSNMSTVTANSNIYNAGWYRGGTGDNGHVRLYGNSRQMVFRTDGTTQYSDNGGYPFVWLYGGDNSGNRRMILANNGDIWTNSYGWLHSYFAPISGSGNYIQNQWGGNQSANFDITGAAQVGRIEFSGVGGNSGEGNHSYAIFQEAGSWSSPFPDLRIAYHTGIKIGGHYSYNGTRFYNNSDMATEIFSVGNGDNNVRAIYGLYSPIMWDYNNSGYYMDPNSNSRLNVIHTDESYTYGWHRNYNSGRGLYNQATGNHLYSEGNYWNMAKGSGNNGLLFRDGYGGSTLGYVYYNGSGSFGLLSPNGNWRFRCDNTNTEAYGSGFYAPTSYIGFIYDRDDTGYYTDPNSTTRHYHNQNNYITTGQWGNYNQFYSWTHFPNYTGIYSANNGAHFYPNNASYGAWRIAGNRNGWYGLEFDVVAGNTSLMWGHTSQGVGSQQIGAHNNSWGWLWYFSHQRLYADGLTDRNDGSYYVDPNSSTQLRTVYANDWFRPQNQTGVYWQTYGGGLYMTESSWIRTYNNRSFLSQVHNYTPGIRADQASASYWASEFYGNPYAVYASGWIYSTYYGYLSTRERKHDIEKFEEADYKSAYAFMDDLQLNYYKMNDDTEYNTVHVGFIAEETPGALTTPGKKGVRYGELSIYNTGAIKVMKEEMEEMRSQLRNISDFGVDNISANTKWINFTDDFKNQLAGIEPVVVITPSQPGASLYVQEVTQEGFRVGNSDNASTVMFSWIAMAKLPEDNDLIEAEYSDKFNEMLETSEYEMTHRPAPKLGPDPEPSVIDPRACDNCPGAIVPENATEANEKNYKLMEPGTYPQPEPANTGSGGTPPLYMQKPPVQKDTFISPATGNTNR